MAESLTVETFEIPLNRRVILTFRGLTVVDAMVHRYEGGLLHLEQRGNLGVKKLMQIKAEELIAVEWEP